MNLGQEAEIALGERRDSPPRGGHREILARGDASGVGNLDVGIVGAESFTKVMLIFIVAGVLLSAS